MTFKLNDKVRIKHSAYSSKELAKGQTGTIIDIDDCTFEIRMDSHYEYIGDDTWPFLACELELVI